LMQKNNAGWCRNCLCTCSLLAWTVLLQTLHEVQNRKSQSQDRSLKYWLLPGNVNTIPARSSRLQPSGEYPFVCSFAVNRSTRALLSNLLLIALLKDCFLPKPLVKEALHACKQA
jgi:hypothetical protein